MDWITAIKNFIDVIDNQSFTKAAEKRYASAAAVSRRISWLEDKVGVKLIQRTTRSLQLTEEGKRFYEKSKRILADLNEITGQLQQQQKQLKGPLKITLPYGFGETLLATQIIPEFLLENSQIELTLDFSNQTHDLLTEEIDIAFRISASQTGFAAENIAELQLGIFAAPDYLKQYGTPKQISDLLQHNCLLHLNIGHVVWDFKNEKKQMVTGNIKSNHSRVLIEFAKNNLGLIRTYHHYVARELHNKKLQPVLQKDWPEPVKFYLIYRDDPSTPLRIKKFVEHIKKHLTGKTNILTLK